MKILSFRVGEKAKILANFARILWITLNINFRFYAVRLSILCKSMLFASINLCPFSICEGMRELAFW